ncbi:hypothetical protein [uncultured Clostridium sp.]|jgi:hypothetical protein|uniref:hypothetical protein n=1 Tax=uncultured Clostridium sp. TaxID=59620 RepID=UPI00263103F1|nr:hypothetical protein [uncultured Clostridium sp.]
MLSIFKNGVNSPEKISGKAKELMLDVVSYRMSGTINASAYNNLKVLLDELVEEHSLEEERFDEAICFEPQKEIRALDLAKFIKGENPREIIIPLDMYADFIISYCREEIGNILVAYALGFNRDEADTVTGLREEIHQKAINFAVMNYDENLDKINLMMRNENDELKIIKPTDEEVGKEIVREMITNFDMFYVRKAYLEKVGIIGENEVNIRNTIFKNKFYNNSLYILRVLLNLNVKNYGDNAIDIGVANCCRISGVKLRGDLAVVVASLEKFANRKGELNIAYADSVAKDIGKFHKDMLENKIDYRTILETIDMLTNDVDLSLVREITAEIALLLLTKYKKGKVGALEKLCILDGVMSKAF